MRITVAHLTISVQRMKGTVTATPIVRTGWFAGRTTVRTNRVLKKAMTVVNQVNIYVYISVCRSLCLISSFVIFISSTSLRPAPSPSFIIHHQHHP